MGNICVNPYLNLNERNSTQIQCIADWAHTQLQLKYVAYAWTVVICIAITWTICSRRQRKKLPKDQIGFSLYLRQWARTSRNAAIITRPVQLSVSSCILILFAKRCSSYEVDTVSYYIITALYTICVADDVIRFFAARYKILYCVSFMTVVELSCLVSHFYVRFAPTIEINGTPTRSWLDFSIMRPLFIYRSFSEMESRFPPYSTRTVMVLRLSVRFLLLIATGAAIIFVLETLKELPIFQNTGFTHLYTCNGNATVTNKSSQDCDTETWSVMYAFYFTVVTLGTVGYGDNAPSTVMSRLLVIIFIGLGVILFSSEIEGLLNLYRLRQIGNSSYEPKFQETRHILVTGNPTYKQLNAVLKEFFHQDHDGEVFAKSANFGHLQSSEQMALLTKVRNDVKVPMHVVVLARRSAKCVEELVEKLEVDPLFASRVSYVAGDATCEEDLERGRARSAIVAMIISDKLAEDVAMEDATNVMRLLAIRRHCGPSFRCLAHVQRAETVGHMIAAGASQEDIICEYLIKMGVLARSAINPGTCTLLANLAISYSMDSLSYSQLHTRAEIEYSSPTSKSRREYSHSHSYSIPLEMSVAAEEAFSDLDFERWQGQHDKLARSKTHNILWRNLKCQVADSYVPEYYRGMLKEIYAISLPTILEGMTFADAAFRIYKESHGDIILIAVEVSSSSIIHADPEFLSSKCWNQQAGDPNNRVLLSPGNSLVVTNGMLCYVIAEDLFQIETFLQVYQIDAREEQENIPEYELNWTDLSTEPHMYISSTQEYEMESSIPFVELSSSPLVTEALISKTSVLGDRNVDSPFGQARRPLGIFGKKLYRQSKKKRHAAVGASLSKQKAVSNRLKAYFAQANESDPMLGYQGKLFPFISELPPSSNADKLGAPPLDVLLDPDHIVICSFLGEEGLPSLQWFIKPLRSFYAIKHPPITIMDATEPSSMLMRTLSVHKSVYYFRGSPIVYSDLQRAGAKAASAVIILGKRANRSGFSTSSLGSSHNRSEHNRSDTTFQHVTSAVLDAETIFCSMLVEMKMDSSKIYTITELVDESNSKYIGLVQQHEDSRSVRVTNDIGTSGEEHMEEKDKNPLSQFWNTLLSTGRSELDNDSSIVRSPLYMSGRLLHPEFCESLLVQTFYEPSIHKIMEQLAGCSRCTGHIHMCFLPPTLFQIRNPCYGDVFQYYTDKTLYPGICMGLYRVSTHKLISKHIVELPIVLTAPDLGLSIFPQDRVFILYGHCTIAFAASAIKRAYGRYKKRRDTGLRYNKQHPSC